MNYSQHFRRNRFGILGLITLSVFILMGCQSSGTSSDHFSRLDRAMDSIKTSYVPDRRVQIFDYTLSSDASYISGKTSNSESYSAVQQLKSRHPELNLDSFQWIEPIDTALINVSVGNIRSLPKHSGELSTQALMGHQVIVWDKKGSWYYIQTPDEYLGWIDAGALVFFSEGNLSEYHAAKKIMYRNDFGFCYSEPDLKSPVISDLTAGDILRTSGTDAGMTAVILPDGRTGFIPEDAAVSLDLLRSNEKPDWASIEQTAQQFIGRPYLWGGTSGKGVDCSGFTKMVYYLNGLELPRDASQQIKKGRNIPLDDRLNQVEPGDFLFFGTRDEDGSPARITHVAIYLGNGKMIHSSERVQINSLYSEDPDFAPNRKKTLVAAKRMITDDPIETALRLQAIQDDPGYGF